MTGIGLVFGLGIVEQGRGEGGRQRQ